jgi:hypothetical protein
MSEDLKKIVLETPIEFLKFIESACDPNILTEALEIVGFVDPKYKDDAIKIISATLKKYATASYQDALVREGAMVGLCLLASEADNYQIEIIETMLGFYTYSKNEPCKPVRLAAQTALMYM